VKIGDQVKFACVDGPDFDGHLVDFDDLMARLVRYKPAEQNALLKWQEGCRMQAIAEPEVESASLDRPSTDG
jgi:hypothetical protein